ncbi:response regulator [Anaerocolumna sp. AGMB13025]|uniref:response regulator transcription factor n=1 Tax=Anaerocolumna sp. AGMB13025 TaxID=3039116 RepID=UPI00241E6D5A|nr:response regulator [Anaerocolumna sp. AGMB13025]WFR59406.1 response regulator [Anaerocolumna sp. AGMB13025]
MMKVFIADDEASILEGLKYIINWKELGFTICGEASNGEDTLNCILALKPDLVLLDIRMPKLQGIEIVKAAREQKFKGHFVILSGFSDFKYAQGAIRYGVDFYLTKPIDEDELYNAVLAVKESLEREHLHTNTMNHYREKAKYTILRDILLNTSDYSSINPLEMNLLAPVYQVLIYENYNQDTKSIIYSFADMLKVTNHGNNSFEHISIHQKDIILLKGEFALERFLGFLNHYEEKPQKGSPLDSLFITYGRLVHTLEDIHYSYEDAFQLLNRRFFCEQNQHAIGYEQLPDFNTVHYEINAEKANYYSDTFCGCIQSFNRKMIADTLSALSKNLYYTNTELSGIKLFLTDIYLQIKQNMNHIYSTTDIPFPTNSSVIDFIESKYYLYEIILFFSEQFEMLMNAIGNSSSESILEDIVYYINHNYRDNIKLETIAPLFGYNSSYLGKIFNKKMGESFNCYIDHVRINHTMELLKQKNLKVYEVSELAGYKNVDYFHKKFKKYVGISPAEYRKKLISD